MTSNPLSKGMSSTSLRDSINAHCYMCMGGDIGDTKTRNMVAKDIRHCRSMICPLHSVRPFAASKQGGNKL